ncbi:hypothetical protein [Haloarcula montana]|uniref:hypothetical protein n=1 Tax=Haloarcula montana TaxID=3111776 RepID=UPI002D77E75B|nr:hypothetical protein [Haloarcula sp. GH36]
MASKQRERATMIPSRVGPPVTEIDGIDDLQSRMKDCDDIRDWSFLLNDYIQWGNNSKVSKYVGIFNLGAAHDCPNRWTERCQVDGNECYAVVDEKRYDYVLAYFRRQEYLWDCLDARTFAEAFLAIVDRKHSVEARALKFSQAGDVRHEADIRKIDRIAQLLDDAGADVDVFLYSASSNLDWSDAEHITVNQSNDQREYGDRRYRAVESPTEIRDDEVWCPYDREKREGVPLDDRTKCGECSACIVKDGPDVAVVK